MLSDGMWYAAMRKIRMNRKIATALRSDMSDEREKNGSPLGGDFRAEATTDLFDRDGLRFLAATAL
mgnify:CR=1 FL=1